MRELVPLNQKFRSVVFLALMTAMFFMSVIYCPTNVFAEFNVTVRPYEGGSDLRFGRVKNFGPPTNKELIVSVNSDLGKQYQLVQTLLEPLANDQGDTLSSGNVFVYAVMGSNRFGTISVQNEVPVSLGRTIIYTSGSQGLSDSFNLVYVIKDAANLPSGSYRGRIAFSLEPFGAAEQPVTVILNIFAEIEGEAGIEIKTISGSKIIALNTTRDEGRENACLAEIKGNIGSPFRITQQLQEPLRSSEGDVLIDGAVTFHVSEAKNGSGPAQATPVLTRPELVYASNTGLDADNFVITYRLGDLGDQKAGFYRSNLSYVFESGPNRYSLDLLSLEVEVARTFDLMIAPETGGTIEFRDLKVQDSPKLSEVTIEVKSNIGRQYQVTQQMLSGLVNKEGKSIPSKQFTLKEESIGTKGTLPFSGAPAEVKTGDMIIFVSDRDGSSDRFKIVYELAPSFEIVAGDYSARLMYSISEL